MDVESLQPTTLLTDDDDFGGHLITRRRISECKECKMYCQTIHSSQSQEVRPSNANIIRNPIRINIAGAFPNKISYEMRLNKQKVIGYGTRSTKNSKWWPQRVVVVLFLEKAIMICFPWKKRDDAPAAQHMNAQLRSTLLHSIVARAIITRAFINFTFKREQT